jgi:hypothetical protein
MSKNIITPILIGWVASESSPVCFKIKEMPNALTVRVVFERS